MVKRQLKITPTCFGSFEIHHQGVCVPGTHTAGSKLRCQTPTTNTKNVTSNFSQARSTLPDDGSQTIRNMSEWFLIVFKNWYNVDFNLWVLYSWVHWSANKSDWLLEDICRSHEVYCLYGFFVYHIPSCSFGSFFLNHCTCPSWHFSATLTEVFPCFFLSSKANARV